MVNQVEPEPSDIPPSTPHETPCGTPHGTPQGTSQGISCETASIGPPERTSQTTPDIESGYAL